MPKRRDKGKELQALQGNVRSSKTFDVAPVVGLKGLVIIDGCIVEHFVSSSSSKVKGPHRSRGEACLMSWGFDLFCTTVLHML
jgi:hypothetical protein